MYNNNYLLRKGINIDIIHFTQKTPCKVPIKFLTNSVILIYIHISVTTIYKLIVISDRPRSMLNFHGPLTIIKNQLKTSALNYLSFSCRPIISNHDCKKTIAITISGI